VSSPSRRQSKSIVSRRVISVLVDPRVLNALGNVLPQAGRARSAIANPACKPGVRGQSAATPGIDCADPLRYSGPACNSRPASNIEMSSSSTDTAYERPCSLTPVTNAFSFRSSLYLERQGRLLGRRCLANASQPNLIRWGANPFNYEPSEVDRLDSIRIERPGGTQPSAGSFFRTLVRNAALALRASAVPAAR